MKKLSLLLAIVFTLTVTGFPINVANQATTGDPSGATAKDQKAAKTLYEKERFFSCGASTSKYSIEEVEKTNEGHMLFVEYKDLGVGIGTSDYSRAASTNAGVLWAVKVQIEPLTQAAMFRVRKDGGAWSFWFPMTSGNLGFQGIPLFHHVAGTSAGLKIFPALTKVHLSDRCALAN